LLHPTIGESNFPTLISSFRTIIKTTSHRDQEPCAFLKTKRILSLLSNRPIFGLVELVTAVLPAFGLLFGLLRRQTVVTEAAVVLGGMQLCALLVRLVKTTDYRTTAIDTFRENSRSITMAFSPISIPSSCLIHDIGCLIPLSGFGFGFGSFPFPSISLRQESLLDFFLALSTSSGFSPWLHDWRTLPQSMVSLSLSLPRLRLLTFLFDSLVPPELSPPFLVLWSAETCGRSPSPSSPPSLLLASPASCVKLDRDYHR